MSSPLSVLVVDDDEDVCKFLQQAVSHGGCTVAVAASATEALELVRARTFDVALVDVVLRGAVSGERLAEMLTRLGSRVIMMSGLINAEERLSLLPYQFVTKPFRLDTLSSLIARASNGNGRA